MVEAIILGLGIFVFVPLSAFFGLSPNLIAILLVLFTLPSLYALKSGPPYFPTTKRKLAAMMELSKVQKGEKVYDLGCGDGRILAAAAKRGATAVGLELSFPLYLYAKLRSFFTPRMHVLYRDFWRQDYRDADVVFCFLLTSLMGKFQEQVWPTLKPGCRVLSNTFRMPGVQPKAEKERVILYVK